MRRCIIFFLVMLVLVLILVIIIVPAFIGVGGAAVALVGVAFYCRARCVKRRNICKWGNCNLSANRHFLVSILLLPALHSLARVKVVDNIESYCSLMLPCSWVKSFLVRFFYFFVSFSISFLSPMLLPRWMHIIVCVSCFALAPPLLLLLLLLVLLPSSLHLRRCASTRVVLISSVAGIEFGEQDRAEEVIQQAASASARRLPLPLELELLQPGELRLRARGLLSIPCWSTLLDALQRRLAKDFLQEDSRQALVAGFRPLSSKPRREAVPFVVIVIVEVLAFHTCGASTRALAR
mmetsp:Transcript_72805/g.158994  ORF Transcript_72805/g.158994 Transcript_72805/m.158994 type:complete len:294 (+) Transcript_72805:2323-3204(+)